MIDGEGYIKLVKILQLYMQAHNFYMWILIEDLHKKIFIFQGLFSNVVLHVQFESYLTLISLVVKNQIVNHLDTFLAI
jgi:hypothetical protein